MDIVEMMEKAQTLNKLMNSGGAGGGNMADMLNIIQLFQSLSNPHEDDTCSNEAKNILKSPKTFEEMSETPATKSMKAAIPYLPYKHQRNIGVMIKLMEIEYFLDNCRETAILNMPGKGDWRKEMLLAIKPQMTEQKKQMIDNIIKCIDLKRMMDVMKRGAINEY